jgi:HipA-like protein
VANAPPITLLHLSDMQFGPHHRFERPDAPGGLLHRLRDDLGRMRDEEGLRPDLVLLTGDLTEYGLKSQFSELLSFAHGLVEVTELPPRRIVMLPGNHDVNWKLSEAYFAERLGNEEKPVQPYWPKLRPYADVFARFYEGQPGIAFTEVEPWTFYEYPDLKLVVAALDSVIAESHRAEDHYGFIGEPQLDFFAGKLRPYKERGWLRIGAVHHDPMHPENDAARQDAKDLKGRLLPYLNVLVHGHIHEEQFQWHHSTAPVLGIGSAGVKVPERPPEVPNQYQWIQVYPDRVTYGTRAYVPDQKRWVGCLRSDREGKAWKLTEKVAFEGVGETFSGTDGGEKAPEADLAAMVDAYRQHWAKEYRHEALFDLAKMGEDADIPAGLDLLHVFVPQTARLISKESFIHDPEDTPRALLELDVPDEQPRLIDEVVASLNSPRLFVLGDPGAGKSALTRWITLKLCTAGERLGELPNDLLPVRIELRRFDLQYRQTRAAGRSYDFFDYLDEIHREHHLSIHGEALRRLADTGRLLWLFDGLDEVADAHTRSEYARRIVGVRERYDDARIIVTSRVVGSGYAKVLFHDADFTVNILQDFDNAQIATFLGQWHRLAFPGAAEAGARRLARLERTLVESWPVRELCGNPLLLTLIALLNRGAALPRQRHRVYERAVELMSDQWEANKGPSPESMIRFDVSIKKRFLRQLAFKMMTELEGGSGNAVRQRDLVGFATEFCARENGLKADEAQAAAEQLIQHLRERNYILTLLGGQTFGFVHKTFLEYLAAVEVQARFNCHEWSLDQVRSLFTQHWRDSVWKETLTLLCGMSDEERPENVVSLIQHILKAVHPLANGDDFIAFACSCLAELDRLDREPMREFCARFTDWIAAKAPFDDTIRESVSLCESSWPEPERLRMAARPFDPDHDDSHVVTDKEELQALSAQLGVRMFPHRKGAYHLKLKELASTAVKESVRVKAAAELRRIEQPSSEWRPVLERLARVAKQGSVRLQAAKELLDERRIAQLARRAKSTKVRRDAMRALEQLRIYRALAQVGRPRRGVVSLDGTRTGLIEETPQGSRFTYDPAYLSAPKAAALSATLPLRPEPFESRGLHPFFENLLPEGWLLDRTCEKLGIDRTDAFGLMLATCADCAGAVEIVPEPLPGLPRP